MGCPSTFAPLPLAPPVDTRLCRLPANAAAAGTASSRHLPPPPPTVQFLVPQHQGEAAVTQVGACPHCAGASRLLPSPRACSSRPSLGAVLRARVVPPTLLSSLPLPVPVPVPLWWLAGAGDTAGVRLTIDGCATWGARSHTRRPRRREAPECPLPGEHDLAGAQPSGVHHSLGSPMLGSGSGLSWPVLAGWPGCFGWWPRSPLSNRRARRPVSLSQPGVQAHFWPVTLRVQDGGGCPSLALWASGWAGASLLHSWAVPGAAC